MPSSLSSIVATETLSVDDQRALVLAAQAVPASVDTDPETGEERVTYGTTPAADAALERLTTAFLPALHKAARSVTVLDRDEAFSVALEAFLVAVREYDVDSERPFAAEVPTRLLRAVKRAERTSDVIVIKENVAAVYGRLMREHDGDTLAAYAACKREESGLAAATFLAIHNVLGGLGSLDVSVDSEDTPAAYRIEGSLGDEIAARDYDHVVDEALVRYLFGLVTDEEEAILRLAYGFFDSATETVRLAAGYRIGELLSDAQIAGALGLSRPTTNRRRLAALALMREVLEAEKESAR